jgi:fatty acid/phospholipid biosynthesis enzyme
MSEPEQVTIRNSVPNILANEAYGPDWKSTQDVMVVNTAGGTSTHLSLKSGSGTTLCGRQPARVARAWFLLSGCKKCSKAAIKQGIATITDTDGTLIDLSANTEVEPPS